MRCSACRSLGKHGEAFMATGRWAHAHRGHCSVRRRAGNSRARGRALGSGRRADPYPSRLSAPSRTPRHQAPTPAARQVDPRSPHQGWGTSSKIRADTMRRWGRPTTPQPCIRASPYGHLGASTRRLRTGAPMWVARSGIAKTVHGVGFPPLPELIDKVVKGNVPIFV
jgi:hypothetical protein